MLALSAVAGLLAGASASIFLHVLEFTAQIFRQNHVLIFILPLGGLVSGLCFHYLGKNSARGSNLILEEVHNPSTLTPRRLTPLMFLGSLLTHLFGGSAGREGVAVQMGASLSDQLGRFVKLTPEERRALLIAGMGSGFGSAVGAPLAGVFFGMEVVQAGQFEFFALTECALASLVAFGVSHLLRIPHTLLPPVEIPAFEWPLPLLVLAAGLMFGLAARAFVFLEHAVARVLAKISFPPMRTMVGGLLLMLLFLWEGTYRYCGLGIEAIQGAMSMPASWQDPVYKLGFSALTIGAGFKGGEFVPLVFVGVTLGSFLAAFCGLSVSLFSSLGFAAVFAAASNTPIACTLMAGELFGWKFLPLAWLACTSAYLISGYPGLYHAQPLKRPKGLFWQKFKKPL